MKNKNALENRVNLIYSTGNDWYLFNCISDDVFLDSTNYDNPCMKNECTKSDA